MSKSITQDMRYRQSLMQYAAKYGVSRASRKYNKSRSYIYYWKARWDGSVASLACQSRRPHHHPNQHTEAELKLIRDMRRRNPTLGMLEFWHRLRKRGYTRRPETLFRVMRKLGMFPQPKAKAPYKAKPYEQMQYPGQRVQVDVKVVPLKCLANPGRTAVPVYRHRRVYPVTLSRRLPGTEHLFFGRFPGENGGLVQTPWRAGRVCANRQRIRIHQPFFQQQKKSAHTL